MIIMLDRGRIIHLKYNVSEMNGVMFSPTTVPSSILQTLPLNTSHVLKLKAHVNV